VVWPSTGSGQRELDSVKTDLIAVERNLVSGNKLIFLWETLNQRNKRKLIINYIIIILKNKSWYKIVFSYGLFYN
jgi:hypothetical protein